MPFHRRKPLKPGGEIARHRGRPNQSACKQFSPGDTGVGEEESDSEDKMLFAIRMGCLVQ